MILTLARSSVAAACLYLATVTSACLTRAFNRWPSSDTLDSSLLVVVCVGVMVNALMLAVTIRRRIRFDPNLPINPSSRIHPNKISPKQFREYLRYKISLRALRRALRVESGFLLCQTARLVHTLYAMKYGYTSSAAQFWAAAEREFVTMMLVYLSVMDLLDRNRIRQLQNLLAEPEIPATDLYSPPTESNPQSKV